MTVTADRKPVPWSGRKVCPVGFVLPWLAPDAVSLSLLARGNAPLWPAVRHDPGSVLLLLRLSHHLPADLQPAPESLCRATLPLVFARQMLSRPRTGVLDQTDHLRQLSTTLAATCQRLAEISHYPDPQRAWCAGLLALLGKFATTEEIDPTALARRLARTWNLPAWLASVLGNLDLTSDQVQGVVDDPRLFALTRMAVALVRRAGLDPTSHAEVVSADERIAGVRLDDIAFTPTLASVSPFSDPYSQPLLPPLLDLAIENRRLRADSTVARLEGEIDQLHLALRRQHDEEQERLRLAKMFALAEFAAGAGHEINNPLAVISGQAQYILAHACDWLAADEEGEAQEALDKIIHQTTRIHTILRELMQFARPALPRPGRFDLGTMIREGAKLLADAAAVKGVQIELDLPAEALFVHADIEQVKTALSCLLRNAIEAAPAQGWARLSLRSTAEGVEIYVDDSGPGPRPEQWPHLFDPFFSGRNAGRGKGFGLPVAWRLAKQQGGDVVFVPHAEGQPTRFILRLPRAEAACAA